MNNGSWLHCYCFLLSLLSSSPLFIFLFFSSSSSSSSPRLELGWGRNKSILHIAEVRETSLIPLHQSLHPKKISLSGSLETSIIQGYLEDWAMKTIYWGRGSQSPSSPHCHEQLLKVGCWSHGDKQEKNYKKWEFLAQAREVIPCLFVLCRALSHNIPWWTLCIALQGRCCWRNSRKKKGRNVKHPTIKVPLLNSKMVFREGFVGWFIPPLYKMNFQYFFLQAEVKFN